MRLRFFIVVSIISSLFVTPAISASNPKVGKKCPVAGFEQDWRGITYICVKQKKNLIWKVSSNAVSERRKEDINKIYSTDMGFSHKFVSPGDIDPDLPTEWIEFDRGYRGQKLAYRLKKYELGMDRPKTLESSVSEFLNVENCKITDQGADFFLRAFPATGSNKSHGWKNGHYPKPKTTIQVIPIYASDTAVPSKSPKQDYSKYFDYVKNFIEYISDVPTSVEIRYPDNYLPFSKPLKPYEISHKMPKPHPTLADEIVAEVDSKIDFSGATMVVVVVPSGTPLDVIQQGPLGSMRTSEGFIQGTSSVYPDTYVSKTYLTYQGLAHPYWWIHEFYHLGIPLDDHYGDQSNDISKEYGLGWWSLMTPGGGDLLTWEKWLLGFITDSQINCVSKDKTTTSWIVPTSVKTNESKLTVIPLSNSKVIVMESIRAAGLYFKHPKNTWGVLTYVVDVTKTEHGQGMKLILPTNRNAAQGPFFLAEAPLRNGESVTYEGVKITVVESGNFGDVVKVEKVT